MVVSATFLLACTQPLPSAQLSGASSEAVFPAIVAPPEPTATPKPAPSRVTVEPLAKGFEYRVNGLPTVVRGVGYNAITSGQSKATRAARYDRDFTLMQQSGFNTLLGWEQAQFDEVLLDAAQRAGMGVIIPFDLYSESPFGDPKLRKQLLGEITEWVERYKRHPALRVWAIGNETIWAIGDPQSEEAKVFAGFLVEASDLIHQLDPDHPVMYRDAEDAYIEPVQQAFGNDPSSRPWFVYGVNFFSERLRDTLTGGDLAAWNHPVLVTEYASAEAGPDDYLRAINRPNGYLRMWSIVREFPAKVIGGAVYVWTTAGPEDLDRSFGLVDAEARPVDGTLAAFTATFRSEDVVTLATPR